MIESELHKTVNSQKHSGVFIKYYFHFYKVANTGLLSTLFVNGIITDTTITVFL